MNHTIPPGTYYLGDPSIVLSKGRWNTLTKDTNRFKRTPIGTVHTDDREYPIIAYRVLFPDSTYVDNTDRDYRVKKYCIGLVPVELMEFRHSNFVILKFDTVTECSSIEGVLTFGDVIIDTGEPFDENDEREMMFYLMQLND
jgi:hypothetical protein